MRFAIAACCCFGVLACSPPPAQTAPDAAPEAPLSAEPVSSEPLPSEPAQQSIALAVAGDPLDLSCNNPLYGFASGGSTVDQLAAALGESNVLEELWVRLYPGDSAREIYAWPEAEQRIWRVEIRGAQSAARLGGALRIGDDLAAVQRFNGAPLQLNGEAVQEFVLADDEDSPCRYTATVRTDAPGVRITALTMSRRYPS